MSNLFARAAALLAGGAWEQAGPEARALLAALGYPTGAEGEGGEPDAETRHRAHLLRAAAGFARIFELAAPDAPGLVSFGAQFDPAIADPMHAGGGAVGVSGVGLSIRDAFQSCIGEGVEYLSQLQTGTIGWSGRDRRRQLHSVRRRATSSRRSRPPGRAPTPSFHGTARYGSAMVAASCCRRICACDGHQASSKSSRRFR